jgi:hypothetical protein
MRLLRACHHQAAGAVTEVWSWAKQEQILQLLEAVSHESPSCRLFQRLRVPGRTCRAIARVSPYGRPTAGWEQDRPTDLF